MAACMCSTGDWSWDLSIYRRSWRIGLLADEHYVSDVGPIV